MALELFNDHLMKYYYAFEESIPFPSLKIRKMTSRWGVCNTKTFVITLNFNLIYYELDCLDYVIVHELSRFIHFDHSKAFWSVVGKYYPNYKEVRKEMRE
jgi:predicted metal-dependent hydrolase